MLDQVAGISCVLSLPVQKRRGMRAPFCLPSSMEEFSLGESGKSVKAGLAGEESFEAVIGEIGVVFFHDVDLLVSPLRDGRGGVELDGNVGTLAEMFTFREIRGQTES
jgi:hypothetical protein